jgi:drug/metabolite transporter (DMT)-like permease
VSVATAGRVPAERTLAERFTAAIPVLSVFVWLCIIYAVEAWAHGTPWLFGDELELTQLSRSIADTGHAARRGEPHSFDTLWTYLMAPAWLINDVHSAYATVKYLAVIVMTATVFPAYGIARMVVGRPAALFAAAAAAAIPAFAYSSMIVEEPLAYPYSTLCLYLILRVLVRPTRWSIGAALVASAIAPLIRGELAVVPVALVLSLLFLAWTSAWFSRLRRSWTPWDWLGLGVLVVGAVVLVSAFLGHHSYEWLIATGFYQDRLFDLGLNAAGALTIGLGVLPVVAGLAFLWPTRGEQPLREVRALRALLLAAIVGFGIYTAVKSTYVSTTFGTYTYERNLIYLAPLLFAGTAFWIERRRVNPLALAVSAGFVLLLLLTTPYEMDQDISYNAPGLAILQQANRYLQLDKSGARIGLVALLALSVAILLAPRLLRRGAAWLAIGVGVAVVAWNLTGELAFANASNRASDRFVENMRGAYTWVDDHTGGASTLYLGQQMKDQNGEWLLEFWNRSIKSVWSLDGTAQGPGPVLTPDPRASDGALSHDPHYPYVVEEAGIDVAGTEVSRHLHVAGGNLEPWRLIKVAPPLRLRAAVDGVYPDGWTGAQSSYTRYATQGDQTGRVRVVVSRKSWGGPDKPGHVTIRVGPITIGDDKQPHVVHATQTKTFDIHSKQEVIVPLKVPGPRFRVEVAISPTFVPQELAADVRDNRELGAKVSYLFSLPRNAAQR